MVAPGLIAEGRAMAVRLAHSKRPAAAARGPATLKAPASPKRVEAERRPLLLDGTSVKARPARRAGRTRVAQVAEAAPVVIAEGRAGRRAWPEVSLGAPVA